MELKFLLRWVSYEFSLQPNQPFLFVQIVWVKLPPLAWLTSAFNSDLIPNTQLIFFVNPTCYLHLHMSFCSRLFWLEKIECFIYAWLLKTDFGINQRHLVWSRSCLFLSPLQVGIRIHDIHVTTCIKPPANLSHTPHPCLSLRNLIKISPTFRN